ncbi:hypothetical protein AB1A81_04360 [Bdellovibrio bacteriovorus]|uniref:Uncharacterized protein n=1 Tax=Bdellovibrio bacteriovorus (strain ATCC 15356 / DSM 50701 / NCIMB 9529 / HD100) TaxID=264462 RepID=Q6MPB6_BDEBA|nr:hypothetical protein [Bdellovibrio bacteriovorus]CAE78882.1 hypothetical protein predicted by Glimmer/Critica [Bdellovibrio bacteriovorus HD100]
MKQDQISKAKNIKALLSATITVLFFSSFSHAAELGESLVLCKHNKTVRTLRVEIGTDQICRAIYTKQGVDETIGSGQNHQSCHDFVTNVRKNLEEAKWSCREVKEARTSNVLINSED